MPSPSAIWVCDSPNCCRMRRNLGPTNSFLPESPAMGRLPNHCRHSGRREAAIRNLEIPGSCFAGPGMTSEVRKAAMATDSGKKLFVGPRFRRIRQQLGLSQTQIAEGLGISPSYINLIERNQRPVTAQILLRLAETYDLDLRDLATADEDRFFAELNEIFSDPLFRQIDLPKQELRDLAELCPGVTHSLQRLYAAYTEARRGETMAAAQFADREEGARFEANPIERVRDLIE